MELGHHLVRLLLSLFPPGFCASLHGAHLSLGRAKGEVVVTWSTDAVSDTPSLLRYGPAVDQLSHTVPAATVILPNNLAPSGAVGPWRNISVHHATILNVSAESRTFYAVDSQPNSQPNGTATAPVYSFAFPSALARQPAPITLAVLGDLGVRSQSGANATFERLYAHHANGDFAAVLHAGDFAYDLRDDYGRVGDLFLQQVEGIAASVPYLTCVGNHEEDNPVGGNSSTKDPPYTNYRARFTMPTPLNSSLNSSAPAPLFWSADVGFAHIVSLNVDTYYLGAAMAEVQYASLQAQMQWLRSDLEAFRQKHPQPRVHEDGRTRSRRDGWDGRGAGDAGSDRWLVVMGHEMMYSSHDSSHVAQGELIRDGGVTARGEPIPGLEPIFHEFGVDLYISGHEHVYERFDRVFQSRADPTGTAHIIVGNAGDREFPYRYPNGTVMGFALPMPPFEAFRSPFPSGYGMLSVPNASAMEWRQFNAATGQVLDQVVFAR